MQAIWVSLKENVDCRSKLADLVSRPEKYCKKRSCTSKVERSESELLNQMENPMWEGNFRQSDGRRRFFELPIGDPSRNIIEMIFRAASTNPSKQSRNIKRVLRVKNSLEIVERFEKYREMVKKKAYEQNERNPRSMVDGNELLQFYDTTMIWCNRKPNWVVSELCNRKPNWVVSELCKEPACGVCRTIQSSFDTEYTKNNGIRLSTSSEVLGKSIIANSKGKNVKRALIVCRTTAGRVVNMVDGENEEDYDSIRSEGLCSKLEYLIVRNPNAILPCFVIVLT